MARDQAADMEDLVPRVPLHVYETALDVARADLAWRQIPQHLRTIVEARMESLQQRPSVEEPGDPEYRPVEQAAGEVLEEEQRRVTAHFEINGSKILDVHGEPKTMTITVSRSTVYHDLQEQIARTLSRLPLSIQLYKIVAVGMDGAPDDVRPVFPDDLDKVLDDRVSTYLVVLAKNQPLEDRWMDVTASLPQTLQSWESSPNGRKALAWLHEHFLDNRHCPQLRQLLLYAEFHPIVEALDRWVSGGNSGVWPTRGPGGVQSMQDIEMDADDDELLEHLTNVINAAVARSGDDRRLRIKLDAVMEHLVAEGHMRPDHAQPW